MNPIGYHMLTMSKRVGGVLPWVRNVFPWVLPWVRNVFPWVLPWESEDGRY